MAGIYDITHDQGTTFGKRLRFESVADDATTTPVDLTGRTYAGMVRECYGGRKVCDITCTLYDAAGGLLDLAIPASATAAPKVQGGVFVYDIECTYPDGSVQRVLQGTFTLTPEATHP